MGTLEQAVLELQNLNEHAAQQKAWIEKLEGDIKEKDRIIAELTRERNAALLLLKVKLENLKS